jgi:hypothetical protein
MSWNQIVKSHVREFKEFMNGYKQSLEQLNADKALLLGNHTEATAPANVCNKIKRDQETWKQEWGFLNGQQVKTMRVRHAKEIAVFFSENEQ